MSLPVSLTWVEEYVAHHQSLDGATMAARKPNFNSGASIFVKVAVTDGSTNAPSCV